MRMRRVLAVVSLIKNPQHDVERTFAKSENTRRVDANMNDWQEFARF